MLDAELCDPEVYSFPAWPCPACGKGILQGTGKPIRASNSGVGFGIDHGFLEPYDDHGIFSITLSCSNEQCGQGVAVSGAYSNYIDDPSDSYSLNFSQRYTIKSIYPALRLISITGDPPERLHKALVRSFALYWSDTQACAAAIRTVIEETANHLAARRLDRRGNPVSLAIHLEDLRTAHPELVEAAALIKDLGNEGAHGEAVERESLLAAYELLEIELARLFNDVAARRQELLGKLKQR
jgi:hypothetical protein